MVVINVSLVPKLKCDMKLIKLLAISWGPSLFPAINYIAPD